MRAAVKQVDRLNKAVSRYRLFTIILGAVCIILVGGGIALGILWRNTETVVNNQAVQAYQSCLSGDDYRAGNKQIWDYFVQLVTKGERSTPATQFLGYVGKVDALRDCRPLKPPAG